METSTASDIHARDNTTYGLYPPAAAAVTTLVLLLDIYVIIANAMIIIAFCRDHKLRVTRNYYIMSLAVADFVAALFVIPLYSSTIPTSEWHLGRIACVIWNIVDDVTLFCSHMSIMLIAYDRYLLVSRAFAYHVFETPFRASMRILVTWLSVFIFKTVFIILGEWYYEQISDQPSCSPISVVDIPYIVGIPSYDIAFSSVSCIIEVFIPLAFMIYFNMRVYMHIRDRTNLQRTSTVGHLVHDAAQAGQVVTNVSIRRRVPFVDQLTRPVMARKRKPDAGAWTRRKQVGQSTSGSEDSGADLTADKQLPVLNTIREVDLSSEMSGEEAQRTIYECEFSKLFKEAKYLRHMLHGVSEREQLEILADTVDKYQGRSRPRKSSLKLSRVYPSDFKKKADTGNDSEAEPSDSINESDICPNSKNSETHLDGVSQSAGVAENSSVFENPVEQDKCDPPSTEVQGQIRQRETTGDFTDSHISGDNLTIHSELDHVTSRRRFRSVRFSDPVVLNSVESIPTRHIKRLSRIATVAIPKYKEKLDRKAGITLAVLVTFFLCFKVPFAGVMMTLAVCRTCISHTVYEVFTWLFRAKVLVNPLLYAFICHRFRSYYVNMFKGAVICSTNGR